MGQRLREHVLQKVIQDPTSERVSRSPPLRCLRRHCLQRSRGGRSDRKSAPLLAAFHGYLEQLRHQCHVSLSAARTYTGMLDASLRPLHKLFMASSSKTLRKLLGHGRVSRE